VVAHGGLRHGKRVRSAWLCTRDAHKGLILERRQRRCLPGQRQVELPCDGLLSMSISSGAPVAQPTRLACKPIDLGEGARDQHIGRAQRQSQSAIIGIGSRYSA